MLKKIQEKRRRKKQKKELELLCIEQNLTYSKIIE